MDTVKVEVVASEFVEQIVATSSLTVSTQLQTLKVNYKQLYENEKKKREKAETDLKDKNRELEELRKKLEELNKIKLSQTNSNTAKNGYKEEDLVCKDLNENEELRILVGTLERGGPLSRKNYNTCCRISGYSKIDIKSENNIIKAQIKKYKKGQFQQLDRHSVDDMIKDIPEFKSIVSILKDLCEYPLLPNKTHIDKSKSIKKLCTTNYSKKTIETTIETLNKYKTKILNYAFLGTNIELRPEYLIGVEYEKSKRNKIVFLKIKDILTYLETLQFKISKGKTVIKLGEDSVISLQRKGGDRGKKSSNQLQIKIIVSKLLDNVKHLEYIINPL